MTKQINSLVVSQLPDKLRIHFDGGCVNPGGVATYGWVISDFDTRAEIANGYGVASEHSTCNVAEYCGLGYALRWLVDRQWCGELVIYGDSQLIVQQVMGRWKCRKDHLRVLLHQCWDLLSRLGDQHVVWWVSRWDNVTADALTRKAYREYKAILKTTRRRGATNQTGYVFTGLKF